MPTISTISPSTFDDGKPVTLTGSGFGASQGSVLIGGVAQNVNTWSDDEITFTTVRGSQSLGACRVDVVGGAATSGLTINGSGFGVGPTVILFHRMDGAQDAAVDDADPEIGEWVGDGFNAAATPVYSTHNGRTRLASAGLSSVYGMRSKRITFSATKQFRVAYRVGVPSGYEWPAGTPTGGPLNGTSHSKLTWFGNTAYPNDGTLGADSCSDLCVPTMIGSSCNIAGNSITLASGKRNMMASAVANEMVPGVYSLLSYYQEPVESDIYSVNGKTHRFTSVEGGSLENALVTCSPYGSSSNAENNYDVMNFPGFHGNDSGAEVRVAYTDVYLAIGANSGKAIILHNAATLAASTQCYLVPHSTWTDTSITTISLHDREKQAYYTVIDGTGAALASGATGY